MVLYQSYTSRGSNCLILRKIQPSYDNPTGETWPAGEIAAKKAWEVAPLGSIEIEERLGGGEKVLLYGFRELWKWGVDNAGFPPLE